MQNGFSANPGEVKKHYAKVEIEIFATVFLTPDGESLSNNGMFSPTRGHKPFVMVKTSSYLVTFQLKGGKCDSSKAGVLYDIRLLRQRCK